MASETKIVAAGDQSILVVFGDEISPKINRRISCAVHLVKAQHIEGIIDMIPTFCSLLINYDPRIISYGEIRRRISEIVRMDAKESAERKRIFELPVMYGGEYGPDLPFIAEHAGISEEEVIQIHSSTDYLIYMLGFLPGFMYLGGLDERIHTPRLANPRLKIPAGSVGIGGSQTGVYPLESPAGWQLLGMTPVKTYDPRKQNPILVEAGDYIRFIRIDEEEYLRIKESAEKGEYEVVIHEGDE